MAYNLNRNIVTINKIKIEMMTKVFMILKEGNEGLQERLTKLLQNMESQNLHYLQCHAKSFNIVSMVSEMINCNEILEMLSIFLDALFRFDKEMVEEFEEGMSDLAETAYEEWKNKVSWCDFFQMSTEVLQDVVQKNKEEISECNTIIIDCLEQNKKLKDNTKANIQQLKVQNSLFQNITYDLNKQNEMWEKLLLIQGNMGKS